MGPAWDFDQACGSSSHGGSGYKGWYAGSELQWFTTLIEMPQFKELVSKRYQEKKTAIRGMLNTIDSTVNKYSFDFAMSNLCIQHLRRSESLAHYVRNCVLQNVQRPYNISQNLAYKQIYLDGKSARCKINIKIAGTQKRCAAILM